MDVVSIVAVAPRLAASRLAWRRDAPAAVDAALEFARDARQVAVHRCARGFGVVGGDRADDRIMILDRFKRQFGGVEMPLHAAPELGALVPQSGDDELQRAIAGRLGDAQMKLAVDRFALREIPDRSLHLAHAVPQRGDVRRLAANRRQCRDFAFDH